MADVNPTSSLESTVWRDDTFFQLTVLNVHTVLKYFSRSPFYDPHCNNEECERQGRPIEDLRYDLYRVTQSAADIVAHTITDDHVRLPKRVTVYHIACSFLGPGVEYVVTFAAEPSLYVVKKQYRESKDSVQQQAFFYVLHGNIYQAPALWSCLNSRTHRCLYNLECAFAQLKKDLEPLAWRHRRRCKQTATCFQKRVGHFETMVGHFGWYSTLGLLVQISQRKGFNTGKLEGDDVPPASVASEGAGNNGGSAPTLHLDGYVPPQEELTASKRRWIRQADGVITNVFARYELPRATDPNVTNAMDTADGKGSDIREPAPKVAKTA